MKPKQQAQTVSFRLGEPLLSALVERAEQEGESRGECARRIVAAALQDEMSLEVLRELEATRRELARLRDDLATSLESVLLNIGHIRPEEIQAFLSRTLRR